MSVSMLLATVTDHTYVKVFAATISVAAAFAGLTSKTRTTAGIARDGLRGRWLGGRCASGGLGSALRTRCDVVAAAVLGLA